MCLQTLFFFFTMINTILYICCMTQSTQTGALYQPGGVVCGGRWEGGSRGWGHMYTYG